MMCRYGTGDLQRWPYNKVTIQVEGNHKESLSKEREGGNAKPAFPPLNPFVPLTELEERGKERPVKIQIPTPFKSVFEGEDSTATINRAQEQAKEWAQVMVGDRTLIGHSPGFVSNPLMWDVLPPVAWMRI